MAMVVLNDNLERWSCRDYRISAEAPWQNCHCERQGGIWEVMMRRATYHRSCTSIEEWDAVAAPINVAKAQLATGDGYSPNMLAFGRKPRLFLSAINEITDGDTLTTLSRAANGDQQIHLLFEIHH